MSLVCLYKSRFVFAVLCKVYGLIGTMAEHMPEDVNAMSRKLLKSLMIDFDYQVCIGYFITAC